jgi:hypothetical protein
MAGYVSERVASTRRAAKGKVKQARKRAVSVVSKRVASMGEAVGDAVKQRPRAHSAMTRILDAAIGISRKQQAAATKILDAATQISQKQQAALEKLRTRL